MEEMEFNTPVTDNASAPGEAAPREGRRLDPNHKGGKWKLPALIAAIVVAVLLAAYLGLCAYAGGERILPGVSVGAVDVGGMSAQEARSALENAARAEYGALVIPLRVGEHTVEFSAEEAKVSLDVPTAVTAAQGAGKEQFFARGWNLLAGLCGTKRQVEGAVVVGDRGYEIGRAHV